MIIPDDERAEFLSHSVLIAQNSAPGVKTNSVHWADNLQTNNAEAKSDLAEYKEMEFFEWDKGRNETITCHEDVQNEFVDFHTLDKVRVICRFRPSNGKELREEKQMGLWQEDPEIVGQGVTLPGSSKQSKKKTFFLDNIIGWKSSQNRCFRVIGWPMVQSVLAGYNATVFAYGQTGSGKTYTMFGPEGNIFCHQYAGITQRALALLFKSLMQQVKTSSGSDGPLVGFSIKLQFLQIYKEKLFDLLNPVSGANLRIRFDTRSNAPYVENITQNIVHSMKEVVKLMKIAISNRITDKTNMNNCSSRSHLLMTVIVEQHKHDGTKINSKLNFGDLAGSESLRKTGVKVGSKQFSELKSINLSLSQLTTLINDIVNKRRPSYRSSKLTYLLQDSIGGNTKTTIVVCASPHISNRQETIRTLVFSQIAKTIKNKAKINKVYSDKQLKKVVRELETENDKLRTVLHQNKVEKEKLRIELAKLMKQTRLEIDSFEISCEAQFTESLSRIDSVEEEKDRKKKMENEHQLRKSLETINCLSVEMIRMKSVIDNLNLQLCEKEKEIKEQIVELAVRNEKLTSKASANQQLMDQVIDLEKKLSAEKLAKLEAEESLLKLKSEVRNMGSMYDKKLHDINAIVRKTIKELQGQKIELDQWVQDRGNPSLQLDRKRLQWDIFPSTGPAEQILERFSINEGVLSGIEHDLTAVLKAWRYRQKRAKNNILPNPNATLACQVRNVIAFLKIAMEEIKNYEYGESERSIRKRCMQKTIKKISELWKHIKSQEETISMLRKENEQLKENSSLAKLEASV